MTEDEFYIDDSIEECTTTGSFTDHDIEDGSTLIQRSYYRLADGDRTEFEPTGSFFDALESAFIWAYLGTVRENSVPEHVEAAIDDARALTAEEFEDQEADLRTEVLPAFYRHLAGFHCAYRG
ncbi:MAG: hypothetical protein J07HX64_02186 [halophilic archaeon J07HX64]|nr:MAG: hypothetical protein J07HX64_02186 [halophilic archaeon J07HX64]